MDIIQGTPFCAPVDIYASDASGAQDADIVIITAGAARKPGQTRIDLAQGNVNIISSVMPEIVRRAPDAVYVVVANPVDILTYHIAKNFGLKENQVIGSGTMLVAPVKVGAGATIGAGSTITKDAPDGKLTLERSRQVTLEGWKRPEKKKPPAG
jgi:acetyltransferase-like isoleucine patch superfamily enzyme